MTKPNIETGNRNSDRLDQAIIQAEAQFARVGQTVADEFQTRLLFELMHYVKPDVLEACIGKASARMRKDRDRIGVA